MKKFYLSIVVLSLFLPIRVLSQEITQIQKNEVKEITSLLDKDLLSNAKKITLLSANIDPEKRFFLFSMYEKKPTLPILMNMVLGFGVGSYIQEDYVTGIISSIGDSLSYIVFLNSLHDYCSYTQTYFDKRIQNEVDDIIYEIPSTRKVKPIPNPSREYDLESYKEQINNATAWMTISAVSFIGFRIFESISPFFFSQKYNKKLIDALGIYDINYSLLPSSKNGTTELSLALKVDF